MHAALASWRKLSVSTAAIWLTYKARESRQTLQCYTVSNFSSIELSRRDISRKSISRAHSHHLQGGCLCLPSRAIKN